jgi:hypothetical protein
MRWPFGKRSTAGVASSRRARGTRHGAPDWGRLPIIRHQYAAAVVTKRRLRKCQSGSGYELWCEMSLALPMAFTRLMA